MRSVSLAQRAQDAFLRSDGLEVGIYFGVAAVGIVAFVTLLALTLIYTERKICAHLQCRFGPMRVGYHGVLQPIADAIKLLFKESIIPKEADLFIYLLAPFLVVLATFLVLIVVPASPVVQVIDVSIGVIYVAAMSGFGILGVLLAGWSSNNKWSMLGAMRAGAQMISYEISATLSLLVVVVLSQSLKLSDIVLSQQTGWWIWRAPVVGVLAFIVFIIASCAEINRTPFDLAEGESELTAGFHTEYSGLRFSFFFLAEFINMFIVSALGVTFFLGGWMPLHLGSWESFNQVMDLIPGGVWFGLKTTLMVLLYMWVRWTFPRLRIDQLMKLEWKILLPLGFLNLIWTALLVVSGVIG